MCIIFKVDCVIVPIIHGGSYHLPTMLIINNSSRFRVPQRVCLLGSPHVGMHDVCCSVQERRGAMLLQRLVFVLGLLQGLSLWHALGATLQSPSARRQLAT